jgi:hypothetical protein
LKNLSIAQKCIYAAVAVLLFGFLIEEAARRWIDWNPPTIEMATVSGIGDTRWLEVLQADLAKPSDAPDLYNADPEQFWKLHPDRGFDLRTMARRYGAIWHEMIEQSTTERERR